MTDQLTLALFAGRALTSLEQYLLRIERYRILRNVRRHTQYRRSVVSRHQQSSAS